MARQKAELLQGTLDILTLKAPSAGSVRGCDAGRRIAQVADDMPRVE